MRKDLKIVIVCAVIFLIVVFSVFIYFFQIVDPMTLKPEVRVTDRNYQPNETSELFNEPPIWKKFEDEYNGKFSVRLQDGIVASMLEQAKELGEDPGLLEDCLEVCDEFDEPQYHPALPCLAEKARFNNTDVWIIVFIWGMDVDDLGHIRFYVIDISSLEILEYQTCG